MVRLSALRARATRASSVSEARAEHSADSKLAMEALLRAYDGLLVESDQFIRQHVMPAYTRSREYEQFIDAKFPPLQRGERERRQSRKGSRRQSIVR